MKVGVITFSESKDNYGQLLQCYAMQEYLRKRGHEPFLIRYHDTPIVDNTGFKPRKIFTYICRFPKYISWYINRRKTQKQNTDYKSTANFEKRDFAGFLDRHINCTPIYNAQEIHNNPPTADAYICGSDQIWAGDDAYYLSFAPDLALKIAYAPSLGGLTSFPSEKEKSMSYLINRLDKVGMREQSGVDTCIRLGRKDAVKVVDPTLLLNSEDYLKIAVKPNVSVPYAFIYLLGNPIYVEIENIFNECRHRGLSPIYVASQGRSDKMPKIDPTIEEWLGLMSEADLVITNSFHCTVFALQFHRKFISIPLSGGFGRMNTRVKELLEECGMSNQFTENMAASAVGDSEFKRFEQYKASQQSLSEQFLSL